MSPPLRIAFVAYRGNMRCGGQGVYLWFLARELARQGHRVDVWVGPPYPDPMPFAHGVHELRNHQYWGKWFMKDRRALIPTPRTRLLNPLEFYEFAASYIGFLPEPFAFSVRALRALAAELRAGERYDVVHDVQCLGWGLLGLRALGLPVVTTVHHPLTVDRRSSFLRDTSLREAIGTMEFYPVGMQAFVARRVDRLFTSSEVSARQIERDFGVARDRIRMVANGVDTDLFSPDPSVPRDPHEVLCVGRASDPNKGVATLVEAIARLPRPTRLTLVDDPHRDNPALQRARKLGIEDRVEVVGRVPVETLVHLYRRAALVAGAVLVRGLRPARGRGDGVRHARGRDRGGLAARGGERGRRRDPRARPLGRRARARRRGAARAADRARRARRSGTQGCPRQLRVAERRAAHGGRLRGARLRAARRAREHDHVRTAGPAPRDRVERRQQSAESSAAAAFARSATSAAAPSPATRPRRDRDRGSRRPARASGRGRSA
jgi:glycosyltransferase involved in cell wall biosynthesis